MSTPAQDEAMIAEITAAFDGVAREEGITLHEAEGRDCRFSPEELVEERKKDTDRHWREVRDEWLAKLPMAICFLDAKGLRYYMPAIMLWHFRHEHGDSRASIADNLQTLLLPDSPFGHEKLAALIGILPNLRNVLRRGGF
jgi:hypothetical protein